MNKLKITIIGNSVALRVRPPQKSPNNKTYSQLLEESLNFVFNDKDIIISNKAVGAYTVYNAFCNVEEFINSFPDFFIINLGVVDSSTREVPIWFSRLANTKKNNALLFLIKALYTNVFKKNRSFFVKLRGRKSWLSPLKFKKYFTLLITEIQKNTNAEIIVLPINIGDERVEKQLPGSQKNHKIFNEILEEVSIQKSAKYLNVKKLKSEVYYPDGVHYSFKGHKYIADEIGKEVGNCIKI